MIDRRINGTVMRLGVTAEMSEKRVLSVINPNYGYALRRWLVSEMEGLPGLKA